MNNLDFFNYLYGLKTDNKAIIVSDGTIIDKSVPSEKNKPSPHSSYELYDLWKRSRKAFPEDTIKVFEVANTNSMEPVFDDNCQVITEELTPGCLLKQPLTKGDVIVYENANKGLIIHRLNDSKIVNNQRVWLLWGDNNIMPDGWINESMFRYRLVGILYGRVNKLND